MHAYWVQRSRRVRQVLGTKSQETGATVSLAPGSIVDADSSVWSCLMEQRIVGGPGLEFMALPSLLQVTQGEPGTFVEVRRRTMCTHMRFVVHTH